MLDTAQIFEKTKTDFQPSIFSSSSRSSADRSTSILVDSTRIFCSIERPNREEISNYKAFFYQFIDKLPTSDRRLISAMLSQYAFVPRPIALYLALDIPSVAAPFLLFSPILTDVDLTSISKKKGDDHTNIIARRRDVTANDINSEQYLKSVLEETREEAETQIDKRAKVETQDVFDEEIGSEFIKIDEALLVIPPKGDEIETQEWLSSDEIVALASVGGKLGKRGTKANSVATPTTIKESCDEKIVENGIMVRTVNSLDASAVKALISNARAVDHDAFCQRVQSLCGLPKAQVKSILTKETGDELAYLIKALAVPVPKDMQLLLMLAPKNGRSFEKYKEAKALLNSLEIGICRMIFNEVGASFKIPGAPEPTRITGLETAPDYTYSAKMRREHISAVSRVEQKSATKLKDIKVGFAS